MNYLFCSYVKYLIAYSFHCVGLTSVGALLTSRIATHLYLVDLSTYFSSLLVITIAPAPMINITNYTMSTASISAPVGAKVCAYSIDWSFSLI